MISMYNSFGTVDIHAFATELCLHFLLFLVFNG